MWPLGSLPLHWIILQTTDPLRVRHLANPGLTSWFSVGTPKGAFLLYIYDISIGSSIHVWLEEVWPFKYFHFHKTTESDHKCGAVVLKIGECWLSNVWPVLIESREASEVHKICYVHTTDWKSWMHLVLNKSNSCNICKGLGGQVTGVSSADIEVL